MKYLSMMIMAVLVMACASIEPEGADFMGECSADWDCDDSDPCTTDICRINRTCAHAPVDNEFCMPDDPPVVEPEPECVNDYECVDEDPCTRDMCVTGSCVNQFESGVEIYTADTGDDPLVELTSSHDQTLLEFYLDYIDCSSWFSFQKLRVFIGSDCNEDGILEADPALGQYLESGDACGRTILSGRGLYDEHSGDALIENVRIKDLATGEIVAGPLPIQDFSSDPLSDGSTYVDFEHRFGTMSCPASAGYAVIADVFTSTQVQVNVLPLHIGTLPECFEQPGLLEAAPRQLAE